MISRTSVPSRASSSRTRIVPPDTPMTPKAREADRVWPVMRAGCKHTVSHRVVQRRRPDRCPVGLIEPTEHEEVLLSLTPEQTGGSVHRWRSRPRHRSVCPAAGHPLSPCKAKTCPTWAPFQAEVAPSILPITGRHSLLGTSYTAYTVCWPHDLHTSHNPVTRDACCGRDNPNEGVSIVMQSRNATSCRTLSIVHSRELQGCHSARGGDQVTI